MLSGTAAFATQPSDPQDEVRQSIIGNSYGDRSSAPALRETPNPAAGDRSGDFQKSVRQLLLGQTGSRSVTVDNAIAARSDATAVMSRAQAGTPDAVQASVRQMLLGERS